MIAPDLDLAVARLSAHRRLGAEVDELATEVTFVLRDIRIKRRGQARIIPGRRLRVMVHEVDTRGRSKTHLPP